MLATTRLTLIVVDRDASRTLPQYGYVGEIGQDVLEAEFPTDAGEPVDPADDRVVASPMSISAEVRYGPSVFAVNENVVKNVPQTSWMQPVKCSVPVAR